MAKKTKETSPSSESGSSNGVLPKLKAVYDFMTQHGLDAIELNEKGTRLKMVRRKSPPPMPVPVPVSVGVAAVAATPTNPAAQPAAVTQPAGETIKSSMMGIFYRASSPSSPPFVKEGDTVKPGQVLCMIEAMKVFNEIKAEFPCTVVKTLLENGKSVKSGQDLFLIKR